MELLKGRSFVEQGDDDAEHGGQGAGEQVGSRLQHISRITQSLPGVDAGREKVSQWQGQGQEQEGGIWFNFRPMTSYADRCISRRLGPDPFMPSLSALLGQVRGTIGGRSLVRQCPFPPPPSAFRLLPFPFTMPGFLLVRQSTINLEPCSCPAVVSFIVLVAIILLIGALSFKVMAQFYVPLFLAAVLVVVFRPLHRWMLYQCATRRRLAAGLTTVSIVLIVLMPLTGLLIRAIAEGSSMVSDYKAGLPAVVVGKPLVVGQGQGGVDTNQSSSTEDSAKRENVVPEPGLAVEDRVISEDLKAIALHHFLDHFIDAADRMLNKLGLPTLPAAEVHTYVHEKLTQAAAPLALGGVRVLVGSLIGVAIMILSLYYFFADGPAMVDTLMRLSPLDDGYEQELLDKFGDISRSVVLATLLSAVVQGLLASVGYYFVGIDRVFFLTALTMFLAMVPFIGSAAVWVPVCAWVYLYQQRALPAAMLALYCMVGRFHGRQCDQTDGAAWPVEFASPVGVVKCGGRSPGTGPDWDSRRSYVGSIAAGAAGDAQQGIAIVGNRQAVHCRVGKIVRHGRVA